MQSSEAIILRTVDFSETSRIVTALTRRYGKIEALAKGGRRLKSPFESSLDILAQNHITYIPKRNDVLDLLTESKLVRRFNVTPSNLAGSFAGCGVAELVNAFTQPDDVQPAIFDLTVNVLQRLEQGTLVMRTLVRFEGNLLHLTGNFPSLRHCVNCNAVVDRQTGKRLMFGTLHGGVICRKCFTDPKNVMLVRAESLDMLEKIIDARDKAGHWKQMTVAQAVITEIGNLLNLYISSCLGYRPRFYDYLRLIAEYDNDTIE